MEVPMNIRQFEIRSGGVDEHRNIIVTGVKSLQTFDSNLRDVGLHTLPLW